MLMQYRKMRSKELVGANLKAHGYAIVRGYLSHPITIFSAVWHDKTRKVIENSVVVKLRWAQRQFPRSLGSIAQCYRQATRTPVLWGCQSTDRMTSLLSRTDHKAGRARDRGDGRKREWGRGLNEKKREIPRGNACHRDNGSPRW